MDLHDRLKKEFGSTVKIAHAGGDDAVDGVRTQLVAAPKDEAAAQALAGWCGREKVAVVARGGGSKIGWGAPPSHCDMILSSRHLNKVIDHDFGNATVTAQSGVGLTELDRQMHEQGQFLPLDFETFPGATLGGVTATNHSGATRLRYKTPRDLIVGMTAVLSDGRLIKNGSKVVKNVSGYDLGKLFIGSYGSLGFITSVTIRLRPEEEQSSWWHCDYNSWEDAAEMTSEILSGDFEPAILRVTAHKSTFHLAARFDGIAESVQTQLQQLSTSEEESALENINSNLTIRAHLPLAKALTFAEKMTDEGASIVQWDAALGVVLASWRNALSVKSLVGKLRAHATANGGILIVQKAPVDEKDTALVWGKKRADFPLHQQLKHRFDAANIFSPGRFWGGL
ncbi:MAG: FAD-binding oxidoreductase [Abditibacteriaceae bacterium]